MAALPLRAVEVAPGPSGVSAVRAALDDRLDHHGPAFALVPAQSRHVSAEYARMVRDAVRPDEPVEDEDTVVVAATSGSTGMPRGVAVTRDNLRAAVEGSWEHVPGLRECAWALALPVTSIGGFGALVRAHLAGTAVHPLDSIGGLAPFRAEDLIALPVSPPFAISLVPTQLADVLASADATRWMADAIAVIVGAAMTPPDLVLRAQDAGIALFATYGMTETTGGCAYNGTPLPGVSIDIDDAGRIGVTGPVVAAGYRLDPAATAESFTGSGSQRRFRTADHGEWIDGRLHVAGRLDDIVIVRGVNVALGAVEAVVRSEYGVADAAVVGVPDDRTGHRVVAFVVLADRAGLPAIAALVADRLGGAARPEVVEVDRLPLLPNGKIDRRALQEAAREA